MKKFWIILIFLGLLLGLTWATVAAPQVFALDWWTVDGGGGFSQGGDYTLQGTIGQPDASSSRGGEYGLEGGFWAGIIDRDWQFFINLPLVIR